MLQFIKFENYFINFVSPAAESKTIPDKTFKRTLKVLAEWWGEQKYLHMCRMGEREWSDRKFEEALIAII